MDGYEFKKGDVIIGWDNKGCQEITLDKKISEYVWTSQVNENHEVRLNNSGWSLK